MNFRYSAARLHTDKFSRKRWANYGKFSSGFFFIYIALLANCGTSAPAFVDRGNHFYDSGKFDDAAIEYQRALQRSPKLGDAAYRLGLTELKRNNPVQAYRDLQRAADMMPNNAEVTAHLGDLAMSIYNADPHHPSQLYQQAAKAADNLLAANPPDSFTGNQCKYIALRELQFHSGRNYT